MHDAIPKLRNFIYNKKENPLCVSDICIDNEMSN